jgi:hypothetical protein
VKNIRKNQLGNIEFALICNLLPLINPVTDANWMIEKGYEGGKTYDASHPFADQYGREFKGLQRYDNLAAFGVGYEIAQKIEKLPGWKDGNITADQVAGILEDVLGGGNGKTLEEACKHYANLAQTPRLLGVQSLTFVPNYYSPGDVPENLRGFPALPFLGASRRDFGGFRAGRNFLWLTAGIAVPRSGRLEEFVARDGYG